MIKKLKIKFILLSVSSLFLLLGVIVIGMNVMNYNSVVTESDEILELLSKNRGTFPGDDILMGSPDKGKFDRLPPHMSPELPYESRYFSVLFEDGKTVYTDISRIKAVDRETAIAYAETALGTKNDHGFLEEFRYARRQEGERIRITFLDTGRRLDSFYTFLYTSIFISLAGLIAVSLALCFFSGRIIRPIAESYEKQKRFITDAGHEIKTPLTIINANVDILEMDLGQNESLADIRQQTKRLTSLTHDLVYLARMEESGSSLPMIEFPLSEVVQEAAEAFRPLADADGKTLKLAITPMLSLRGNDRSIGQLVNILMENAVKYSPAGSEVRLTLTGQGRAVTLTVSNPTSTLPAREDLDRVFDRFYRADPARNSKIGGHGIGLSVARAIVSAHGGKIHASAKDGNTFCITAVFPI